MSCLVRLRRMAFWVGIVGVVGMPISAPAAVVYSGAGSSIENDAPVSAKVEFSIVGDFLTLILTNTTAGGTKAPGDSLTGVLFDLSTTTLPNLQLTSIALTSGSSIYTSKTNIDNSVDFNGSWTDDLRSSAYDFGVATTGVDLFSGASIGTGNAGPDYAIIAGTESDSTGPIHSDLGGSQYPYALNSLTFTFSGALGVGEDQIGNVAFFFGTREGPVVPGNGNGISPGPIPTSAPEPSSIFVWAGALAVLGLVMSRRRSKVQA